MIFPWQQKEWRQLCRAKESGRLPHALLFSGLAGIGKTQLADYFSRLLLCQQFQTEYDPKCQCHSCRLAEGRAHPNVLWITPEKEGQAIKVDQIREVSDFIYQSARQGEYNIVVIHPANQMNVNAANALLKTLEEPPHGSLLILISQYFNRKLS